MIQQAQKYYTYIIIYVNKDLYSIKTFQNIYTYIYIYIYIYIFTRITHRHTQTHTHTHTRYNVFFLEQIV